MAERFDTNISSIARPVLEPGEVHIWPVSLQAEDAELAWFRNVLSDAEHIRAERFIFDEHRNRFLAGRARLRLILASYLGTGPAEIRFVEGRAGKPAIARSGPGGLQFNLSHSENQGLVAVTLDSPVGIDIERVRVLEDAEHLVRQFFSTREARLFHELPAEQQPQAFFNLWTRKEALLKATGEGIGYSLHLVEVSFLPGEPVRILSVPRSFGAAEDWLLQPVPAPEGFAAALAIHPSVNPVRTTIIQTMATVQQEEVFP